LWRSRVPELWERGASELWSPGVTGTWSSGLVVRRAKEMIQLQLMCCALSNFSSSQFMRGRTGSYGIERKT